MKYKKKYISQYFITQYWPVGLRNKHKVFALLEYQEALIGS